MQSYMLIHLRLNGGNSSSAFLAGRGLNFCIRSTSPQDWGWVKLLPTAYLNVVLTRVVTMSVRQCTPSQPPKDLRPCKSHEYSLQLLQLWIVGWKDWGPCRANNLLPSSFLLMDHVGYWANWVREGVGWVGETLPKYLHLPHSNFPQQVYRSADSPLYQVSLNRREIMKYY